MEIERQGCRSYYAHQSALKGNINAQFDIAMMYGTGSNVEKNERKELARYWFRKAAKAGHTKALSQLAELTRGVSIQ